MKNFIINIGGTSSKVALFDDTVMLFGSTIRHNKAELSPEDLWDQYDMRKKAIVNYMAEHKIDISELTAIVSRGPSVKPLVSGVYRINEQMIRDARSKLYGNHPCGLGCGIALELSNGKIPALTVDPPCVDEMIPLARYTGIPGIKRKSFFQALNHKAVAKRLAKKLGKSYSELNIVVSHLGSGISVASHCRGKVIDVTNGLDGDAPFGLDRVGTLPAADWMRFILSGKYTAAELDSILNGHGGIKAYLGTNSALEVETMIQAGNQTAKEVYEAMAFQVAKGVGAACAVFAAKPDGIILTGGLANSDYFISMLKPRISWLSELYVFAGEDEMTALNEGAICGLTGEEPIKEYS